MNRSLQVLAALLFLNVSTEAFLCCQKCRTSVHSSKRTATTTTTTTSSSTPHRTEQLLFDDTVKLSQDDLHQRIQGITTIATDVDGTLLSSTDHTLSETTKNMIQRAVAETLKPTNGTAITHFFPATGKSRKGALDSLGPEIRDLLSELPGVFIQGLYCVGSDGSTIIFEKKLPISAIVASEIIAAKFNTTIIGNIQDLIYCNSVGDPELLASVHSIWGEPIPIEINSLTMNQQGFHKLVFLSNDINMLKDQMRPELERLAKENGATVTTSHPTILELLPEGCSKAHGVKKLCEHLGINPTKEVLALGDAENDKDLLEMACIGVAMGNASPIAKGAADIELVETSGEGGAGYAMERYSKLGSSSSSTHY